MDWGDAPGWGGLVAAAAAIVISIRFGRRSAIASERAADSAAASAASAEAVTKVDHARWLAERTPLFEINIKDEEGDRATLNVQLAGPPALGHLDGVKITIGSSDDLMRRPSLDGRRPTQEDLGSHVFGPWRFTHSADGADAGGTTVDAVPLRVGRGRPFAIERTRPPFWEEGPDRGQRWRDRWAETPVKLSILCSRDGEEWTVPVDVDQPLPPPFIY